jgi:arsenate reductase-like glutaredoxin family protein
MNTDKQKKPSKDELAKMITSVDIDRYLNEGSTKIIKYSELGKYYNDTVEELLPHDKDYRIILIEQNYNSGHWVCIMRYGKTIEWFDSYGIKPPNELNFISTIKNKMLGQSKRTLTDLLGDAHSRGWEVVYNKKKLQKLKAGINTCGRWVLLRITMMKDMMFNLPDFLEFVEKNFEGGSLTKDEMVANWVK